MSKFDVAIGERVRTVAIDGSNRVTVDGSSRDVSIEALGPFRYSVLLAGKSYSLLAYRDTRGYCVLVDGVEHWVAVRTERDKLLGQFAIGAKATQDRTEVRAPLPALVVNVEVGVGDTVTEGQGLVILEAMKMENELRAHTSGTVKEILVVKGKKVEKGETLIIIQNR